MFPADTDEEIGIHFTSGLDGHIHQFADTAFIQSDEGANGQNFLIHIGVEEFSFRVITRKTKCSLGKVVSTKGEELCFPSLAGRW